GFAVIIRQKLPQRAVFYRLIQPYHGAEIGIGIKPETGAMFGMVLLVVLVYLIQLSGDRIVRAVTHK
ncbi:hypothetical protein MJN47_31675, partial [Salmonella enterica subsp. enterica serovar Lubbock]|nr:hypothetical protein [Salmonella enterica subsp. enterica serovar Lubbock]